ncbi:MAG: type VI secretion system-associated FHA domain protein TagH [Gammaproteobacteria bacterium]|nr:type VI secretion system-associated FHA domain protein TagH [Gammaproteobacteria bacterium]
MTLKIKVTGRYAKSFKDNAQKEFTVHGGTMGRSVDNTWVLPDPHRHISGKHAAILNKDGHYFVLDTSTNGVFMNKASTRIGRGNSARLSDGDTFRISDFIFQVSLKKDKDASVMDKHPADMSLDEKDDMISYAALLDDDLASTQSAQAEASQRDRDFADEFLTETIAPDSLDEKIEGWELMELPESAITPPPKPRSEPSVELLAADEIKVREDLDLSLADENLDDMLTSETSARLTLVEDFPGSESTITEEDRPRLEPAPRRAPEKASRTPEKASRTPEKASRTPEKASPAPAKSTADSGTTRGDAVLIFLQAAGMDVSNFRPQDSAQIMQNAGQLLREFVVGAKDTIMNRSEIKSTLRVAHTTIQEGEYNPLRFSAGVDESLRALLFEKSRRNMSPVDAVRQSFHATRVHQLAMVHAMNEAVKSLYDRFDPVDLEERFDRGMKRGPILGTTNKLKYWGLFADLYNAMAEGRNEGTPHMFVDEFSRAYDARVKELMKSTTPPKTNSKAS